MDHALLENRIVCARAREGARDVPPRAETAVDCAFASRSLGLINDLTVQTQRGFGQDGRRYLSLQELAVKIGQKLSFRMGLIAPIKPIETHFKPTDLSIPDPSVD